MRLIWPPVVAVVLAAAISEFILDLEGLFFVAGVLWFSLLFAFVFAGLVAQRRARLERRDQ